MSRILDEQLVGEARRILHESLDAALAGVSASAPRAQKAKPNFPERFCLILTMPVSDGRDSPPREDPDAEAVRWALLDAAGTLCCLGLQEEVEGLRGRAMPLWPVVRPWLQRQEWEELNEGAQELADLEMDLRRLALDEPGERDPGRVVPLQEQIVEILSRRDRLQLAMAGCRALWGEEMPLSETARFSVDSFDLQVRQMGYLLLSLNERRRERLLWMAPEMQREFWWWERGIEYPSGVLHSFFDVAQLLHDFPEAIEFLDDLRNGFEKIEEHVKIRKNMAGAPSSLRKRLLEHGREDAKPLRLAASTASPDIREIYGDEDFGIYVSQNRLYVYLKNQVDDFPEFLPTAYFRAAGSDLELFPVSDRKGDYAFFDLDSPAFSASRGTLYVHCGSGRLREILLDERLLSNAAKRE